MPAGLGLDEVAEHHGHLRAGLFEFGGYRFAARPGLQRVDENAHPRSRQPTGDCGPDAAAGAGDEDRAQPVLARRGIFRTGLWKQVP